MIELLSNGVLNTVQDGERPGRLSSGVSPGGAMDRPALEAANRLVGNAPSAAGIEVQLFPFRLRALTDIVVAVIGCDCAATVDDAPMPPWWARPMREGQTLALRLGSRSTDIRRGFGGHEGRGLAKGDKLPLWVAGTAALSAAGWGAAPPDRNGRSGTAPIRVIPAAEYRGFTEAAKDAITGSPWRVTREANRMGYRPSGPGLMVEKPLELFSHGILPGTIQVPPAGQPIIQLADANTCGGYPKIATVIEADLWRLAQAPAGSELRFAVVQQDEALEALRAQARWLADLGAARKPLGWVERKQ